MDAAKRVGNPSDPARRFRSRTAGLKGLRIRPPDRYSGKVIDPAAAHRRFSGVIARGDREAVMAVLDGLTGLKT
ncbi:hypothetical protein [Sphingomonas sp. ERG5]|uniref:hypothetical protein n=1 Tax=Sphingomonas sp. ERG5 TaxID=1381597 RepID=UPI00054B2C13|nr:hypothetical protein [Sphingomonas sp. ERG5]